MKKRRLIIIMLLMAIVLTGCWNRRELNELAIAVGFGVDKDGEQYRFSVQVVDPGEVAANKGGTSGRTPVTMYHMSAPTIFEALRKMTTVSPRKIYNSHLRILVIGEAVAKDGLGEVLDFVSRDQEMRTDFYIVVAKEGHTAEEALKILTPIEKIPANNLFHSLAASAKAWAPSTTVTLDQLIADLVSDGKQPVLTGLRINGNAQIGQTTTNIEKIDNAATLQYTGLAVFKEDKLIGWLNQNDSIGYNFILNNIKSTVGSLACPNGGTMVIEVIRSDTKVKGFVEKGKPRVEVKSRIEANVGEMACHLDLTKTSSIAEIEKIASKRVQDLMKQTVSKVQKQYKVDIFGFGEAVHRANAAAWKAWKKDWDVQFAKLPVDYKVEVKIRRLGTVSNSFLQEMNKE
ncbi:Ger(x)C family spore germination protein [Brevibacillus nitrificans]|uniref:Ger(X)C family spore germination protein n=1 Tax=Brevibacillus nitrificans TaxID=651560 RepID=A0A3M8DFB5_9BACL|nr:Ger(x)C family spore germination protein [Brevibacillus nitrificans]RNB86802.1 Ger(x)C family spore germination protein [Brevibacillus nitrificans]